MENNIFILGESRAELQGNSSSSKTPSAVMLIFLALILIWHAGASITFDDDNSKLCGHPISHERQNFQNLVFTKAADDMYNFK
jgi:hypothetical protein